MKWQYRLSKAGVLLAMALLVQGCPSCSEDPLGGTETLCTIGAGGGSCALPGCVLIVAPDALDRRTDITLSLEPPADPALAAEVLGGTLCVVGPADLLFSSAADLRMTYDVLDLPPEYVPEEIIGIEERAGFLALLPLFVPDLPASEVALSISTAGRYGLSLSPDGPDAAVGLGGEYLPVTDAATFLRNVTSRPIWAAFWDGERLFVGNGPRVLVYYGIPDEPARLPDFVLGRPNLVDDPGNPSASNLTGVVTGIWSDGTRLAVASGHRVLVWLTMPDESYAPADVVLGQPSFGVDVPNNGGVSATSLWSPDDIWSDGTRFAVADSLNNRWLLWNEFPVLSGTPADLVIGQPDMGTNGIATGAVPAHQARGIMAFGDTLLLSASLATNVVFGLDGYPSADNPPVDFMLGTWLSYQQISTTSLRFASGISPIGAAGIALRDVGGGRIAIWDDAASAASMPISRVLGRPHPFTGGNAIGGVSASSLVDPAYQLGVYADDSIVVAPDGNRLLVWTTPPAYDYAPADRVLFTGSPAAAVSGVDYRRVDDTSLARPVHAAADGTWLAVADSANNRVLLHEVASLATGAAASVVVGQPDFASFWPNRGGTTSARGLSAPEGVSLAAGRLAVADTHNHRVLLWNEVPASPEDLPDVVLGAADFDTAAVNGGNGDGDGDGDPDADASGFFYPTDVELTSTTLYVADRFNHRVLVWSPLPTASGAPASGVVGQPDFDSNEPNRGAGFHSPVPDGLNQPSGLATGPAGELLVADEENNRVLIFPSGAGAFSSATRVVGQPDAFTVSNRNFFVGPESGGIPMTPPATPATLDRPYDVLLHDGGLWVADTGFNRVAVWTTVPTVDGASADVFLGQLGGTTATLNAGGVGAAALSGPTGLAPVGGSVAVVDRGNHRLMVHDLGASALATFRAADVALGQPGLDVNAFNAGDGVLTLLDRPLGTSFDGARVFVADTDHHRVVWYDGVPATDDAAPVGVLGQASGWGASPNRGSGTGPDTLHTPSDVYSDGTWLVIADTGNHRVLVYETATLGSGAPPVLVLGQPDLDTGSPNAGAGPSLPGPAGLFSPRAVLLDPSGLYVADTGNNRVLVWDSLPGASGAPADLVLGQADLSANLVNRGASAPAAASLAGPEDVLVAAGAIWVADALNNRVLRFDLDVASGGSATTVLGQPDFTSRSALGADGRVGAATMSYPSGLASDGRYLFVSDLSDNRILLFPYETITDGTAAWTVMGQLDFESSDGLSSRSGLFTPSRLDAFRLPFNETVLLVADAGRDRVVVFDQLPRFPELIWRP